MDAILEISMMEPGGNFNARMHAEFVANPLDVAFHGSFGKAAEIGSASKHVR